MAVGWVEGDIGYISTEMLMDIHRRQHIFEGIFLLQIILPHFHTMHLDSCSEILIDTNVDIIVHHQKCD